MIRMSSLSAASTLCLYRSLSPQFWPPCAAWWGRWWWSSRRTFLTASSTSSLIWDSGSCRRRSWVQDCGVWIEECGWDNTKIFRVGRKIFYSTTCVLGLWSGDLYPGVRALWRSPSACPCGSSGRESRPGQCPPRRRSGGGAGRGTQ